MLNPELIQQTNASSRDQRSLSLVAENLEAVHCVGLADKFAEYKGCGPRSGALIAELRMALALSRSTRLPVTLQVGEAHDPRVGACTVEVQHKSSVFAFNSVFYPDPDAVPLGQPLMKWQVVSQQLQEALKHLPFEIQPWIDGELARPHWSRDERARQEELCGEIAERLLHELKHLQVGHAKHLHHGPARFDVAPSTECQDGFVAP
jgi:hypothetical protein